MQKYEEGYDKYAPQSFRGSAASKAGGDHDAVSRDSQQLIEQTKNLFESMDFEESESVMWRKHQLRRFFQDRGTWWTNSRRTTARKWVLVVLLGLVIGGIGYFVSFFTAALDSFKFDSVTHLINDGHWEGAFFVLLVISLFFSCVAGLLCWMEPMAASTGIPQIKAYLNGINLNKAVRIRVLVFKVIGMCFSVAAGLPLGKEGPMIHVGAVAGAAISQGRTATFGFDTSWTKFQDLRNDRSKRDFVTFGAAAGVAAAFSAPIGGVLFTLEEGASYWSTNLTFRAFFCAMITQLTLNLLYSGFQLGRDHADGLFAFGLFTDFSGYATFELFIFILMGAGGGVMGAFFVHLSHRMAVFRQEHITTNWKRAIELLVVTTVMTVIIFVVPLMWATCTAVPTDTADWTDQEVNLLDKLVKYQCSDNQYNQVASLYFVPADVALQQLFHFKESGGTTYTTFDTGALLMFFIPYSAMAVIAAGLIVPSGIFVPSLLAGGAYGRIVGHILNIAFPGYVTDSGTYALIGGAAMMGGVSRMTMAGTIIMLEASGNSEYLLPLMLTFAAARYTGNAMSEPLYDMFIRFKHLPFLENSLKTLGLLNYHPVVEVMAQPVITLNEINRVGDVHRILSTLSHNGFPVVGKTGHLRGLILRKHLCTLIKLKAFSAPTAAGQLAPAATVFHDTLERTYPNYPRVEDINLTPAEMNCWLDVRPYMDTSPYTINASSSIQRCFRFFRTMGLRHLVVLDGDHRVTGIITRKDIAEERLEHHWFHEGDNMQRYLNIDPMDGAAGLQEGSGLLGQLPGMDDEPPSMPTPVSGLGSVNAGAGAGAGVFAPQAGIQPSIASTRVPAFTSSSSAGGGSAVAMTTPVSSGAGYVPPSNPFGSPDGGGSTGYELSETTSNPLASRYPAPTISAAGAGAGGAAGAGPSPAPAPSASKSKKAMKEPKSMRSST